ncbi:hypothetical protein MNBD_GAMMA16-1428 [hydrothermal vent metagenome]|uniref:DUF2914 domain-containing protein n=1 Tax=hydrothermal vent metagenome TaxID=652676 RepID=A0A3B0Z7R6_9ZZZZ
MKYFIFILYSVFSISAYAGGITSIPAKSLINHAEPIVNKTLIRFDRFVNTIGGSVSRAAFTRAVVNREPIDALKKITNNLQHLYFFTELKGFMGETVFHRWEFDGEIMAEMKFRVGGPRWRVWSNTNILPNLLGEWKVYVVDITGRIIQEAIIHRE